MVYLILSGQGNELPMTYFLVSVKYYVWRDLQKDRPSQFVLMTIQKKTTRQLVAI